MRNPILKGYFGSTFFDFILQDNLADAVIILPGFPSNNDFSGLIHHFYNKGYHVFVPRYRGTYQSHGKFLGKNPVDEIADFVNRLDSKVVKDLWDGKKKQFKLGKKIIVADSFGGAIACGLAAKYPSKFSHLILSAPIWDFQKYNLDGKEQDIEAMTEFVRKSYKNCYRFKFKSIKKVLAKYQELKPEFYASKLKLPVLVVQDPNDTFVSIKRTQEMIPKLLKVTLLEHRLGHYLTEDLMAIHWQDIDKFIKINYLG
jgi:pimeloyl-ACP methyl ester carboxylesterase